MVKKIAMVLLCTALGNSVYARDISESQTFLGVEVGLTEVQGEQPSDESDDVSYGLRLGAQNEQWRTMFALNYFDSGEHNIEKFFLSVDYFLLESNVLEDSLIRPYIGVNVGYMNFESTGVDESGLLYGMQGGVVFSIVENIDFDISYRYSLSNTDALDHTSDVVFGIHYRF